MATYRKYGRYLSKNSTFEDSLKELYAGGQIGNPTIGEAQFPYQTEAGPNSPMNVQNNGPSTGQYAQAGATTAVGLYSASQMEDGLAKDYATEDAVVSGVSSIGPVGAVVGGIWGAGNMIGRPIREKGEVLDENGKLQNRKKAGNNYTLANNIFNPVSANISTFSNPDATTGDKITTFMPIIGGLINPGAKKRYLNSLEKTPTIEDNNYMTSINNSGQVQPMAAGGSLTHYNAGGSHEENPMGGIPVGSGASVEEGEVLDNDKRYVYSDRITIDEDMAKEFSFPKKAIGKTMAEYAKLIEKENPRENDGYDKDTKRLMFDRLTEANESAKMKMFEDDYESLLQKKLGGKLYQMYRGGHLRKQMWDGDWLNGDPKPVIWGPTNPTYEEGYNQWGVKEDRFKNYKLTDVYKEDQYSVPTTPTKGTLFDPNVVNEKPMERAFITSPSNGGTSTGVSNANNPQTTDMNISPMYDIGRLAPIAANLISGSKYDKLNKRDYRINSRIKAPNYNITDLLDENRSDYNNAMGMVREASGGSGGTFLANLANLYARKAKANAAAYAQKENTEGQLDMQAQMANADIEGKNVSMDFTTDDWNARSKAAARNQLLKATGQMGEYSDAKVNEAFMEAYVNSLSDNYKYNFTRKFKSTKK